MKFASKSNSRPGSCSGRRAGGGLLPWRRAFRQRLGHRASFRAGPIMYHRHFRLSGPPFQFTPAPDALYLSRTHREALAALEWGLLHEPTGFTMLAGESGVGKTTLVSSLLPRPPSPLRTAL